MRSHLPIALGVAVTLLAATGAQAQQTQWHHGARRLPPVTGTLRMSPDDFGRARMARHAASYESVRVVRGGLYPRETDDGGATPDLRWATAGTGLAGLVGNTGNPYLGQTQWGTADSATAGAGFAPRYDWRRRGLFTSEPSLAERYGEPAAYAGVGYDGQDYGAAPQLPFYGSGAPSGLSYYSSGSSAGPYGSPGGLGTYRSGSYGYGPRIVETDAGYDAGYGQRGCTCGPRIVHLRRHHRYYSER